MLTNYFAVALGGALGSVTRVLFGKLLPTTIAGLPLQILCVNILGCFIMGVLVEAMASYWSPTANIKSFLTTGFLGGFTTFSSFALEFGLLFEKNQFLLAALYVTLSVGISLTCFFLGMKLIRLL